MQALTALDLYERTVQDPARAVDLLVSRHGGSPRILGEDFAGSAALSRCWVERVPGGRAIAVDLDGASLGHAPHPLVEAHVLDARSPTLARLGPCDVVHAGNFSIGELHARAEVLGWARSAHARLVHGGIVAVDTYGGESAWRIGALERRRREHDGSEIRWLWEQRAADPLTAEVVNALSFRVLWKDEVVIDRPDAFVYRWRLWSVPEIIDVLREAGFAAVDAHTRLDALAPGVPEDPAVHAGCVALVTGRK
ncbi:MAG: hypothetical protein NTY35_17385 [Planctomycetota bacterium]|nr:hypothetical protein [Planctomycetota bacterium]